ncbi:elafin [Nothoprocta perdicaria]|uniref:elafin n=1 Tax=Nothoprocta perdicaria TaxID=30464 RepID=UPI000E1C2159|nr:elafin [Nothoprocta perdicaria]
MKPVAAVLLAGLLILWTELPAGSAWSCPKVQITCAMVNPPNHCFMDQHCPRFKKCCPTFCGRRCISRPPAIPISYV